MFEKTSSLDFQKFGITYDSNIKKSDLSLIYTLKGHSDKVVYSLYSFNTYTYVEVLEGMALIVISDDDNNFSLFAVHHHLKINPNVHFNLIPLTDKISFNMYLNPDYLLNIIKLDKPYIYKPINQKINVTEILGSFYVIKSPNYKFNGEAHDFYELTYVDNGVLDSRVSDVDYSLKSGDLMIYGPNQFHTQSVSNENSCSYLTILFKLDIDDPSPLLNQVFHCDNNIHSVLKKIIDESSHIDIPYTNSLFICHLQELIIMLLQYNYSDNKNNKISTGYSYHFQDQLLQKIVDYIYSNSYEPITIYEICRKFCISRSSLQLLFKNNLNISPKNFMIEYKMKKSKELIRENKYTISEISLMLGFSSIHYFSKTFKHHFNVTPSEYAKQILKK